MRHQARHVCLVAGFLLLTLLCCPPCHAGTAAAVYDEGSGFVYIPPDLEPTRRYPLLVVLSPSGDPNGSLDIWQGAAEELKVFIFASKDYRNGINMQPVLDQIAAKIAELASRYAIDETRVISAGLSGGGMGSHAFAYHHAAKILGIIVNTGMMHRNYQQQSDYPTGKKVVFLASPTDFRYGEMQEDYHYLKGLQWEAHWLEFEGGHVYAPEKLRKEALEILLKKN